MALPFGDRETRLLAASKSLVAAASAFVHCDRPGGRREVQALCEAWAGYLERFALWKVADASALESQLTRMAVSLARQGDGRASRDDFFDQSCQISLACAGPFLPRSSRPRPSALLGARAPRGSTWRPCAPPCRWTIR